MKCNLVHTNLPEIRLRFRVDFALIPKHISFHLLHFLLIPTLQLLPIAKIYIRQLITSHKSTQMDSLTSTSSVPQEDVNIDMLAPPERQYLSKDDGLTAIHEFTKSYGYELVLRKPEKNQDGAIYKYYLECKRHGRLSNTRKLEDSDRIRTKSSSMRQNCQMRIIFAACAKRDPTGQWEVRSCSRDAHNHPADEVLALPGHRKRSRAQFEGLIQDHQAAAIQRKRTVAVIKRADPNAHVLPKDIANTQGKQRMLNMRDKTSMEQLFDFLQLHNFTFFHAANSETGALEYLLCFYPTAIKQIQAHPDMLGFDCTYSTNIYNLPLLNIVGATAQNSTIQVGLAILSGEREEDFRRVFTDLRSFLSQHSINPRVFTSDRCLACLNSLAGIFPLVPIIICQWHLNKAVITQVRKRGESWAQILNNETGMYEDSEQTKKFMALFYQATNAATEKVFVDTAVEIKAAYPEVARYLEKEWWPHRHRIVKFWTDKVRHFGEKTTSRIEGSHHSLKVWLETSRSDVLGLFQKLLPHWQIQQDLYIRKMSESLSAPYELCGPFFQSVIRIIHRYPLLMIREVWSAVKEDLRTGKAAEECFGGYSLVFGMPCKHQIRRMLEQNTPLLPSHFDAHWWIERLVREDISEKLLIRDRSMAPPIEQSPRLREPISRARRLPSRRTTHAEGHGRDSTRRLPTQAELTDQNNNSQIQILPAPSQNAQSMALETASGPSNWRSYPTVHGSSAIPPLLSSVGANEVMQPVSLRQISS